jgi:hypothetical protein
MRATRTRSAVLAAACLCGMAAPFAQQAPPQVQQQTTGPATSMIAGRVIDAANGQGVPSASVTLLGGSPVGRGVSNRMVLTDTRGRFVFPAIGGGRYQIRADRQGFWSVPITGARSVDVGVGEKIIDLAYPLHRYGSISGTVTDENGDAVSAMMVAAFRRQMVNGQMSEISVGGALTDDRGAYRIAGLKAGDYCVCACARPAIPFDGVLLSTLASQPAQLIAVASRALKVGSDAATVEGMRTYGPAFHGGGSAIAKATRITLADGDEPSNIDIQTPVVYAARVSGVVVGATGTFNAAMLRLRPVGSPISPATALLPMVVQPDGRFDFAAVPAGEYVLEVTAPSVVRPGPPTPASGAALAFVGGRGAIGGNFGAGPGQMEPLLWARVPVTVVDRDIEGLTVPVRPAFRVSGTVEWPAPAPSAGRGAAPPRTVQLLQPAQFSAVGEVKPDGTFALANALPGRYTLSVPSAFQVVKVMVGDADVTDLPFVIDDRDVSDIKVTLDTPNRPTLQGQVSADPKNGLTIVVFPASKKLWADPSASSRWFATGAVSRSGNFQFASLLPVGDYFIAALPDDQGVSAEWQSLTALEALAAKAQKITIGPNEVKTIEVKR